MPCLHRIFFATLSTWKIPIYNLTHTQWSVRLSLILLDETQVISFLFSLCVSPFVLQLFVHMSLHHCLQIMKRLQSGESVSCFSLYIWEGREEKESKSFIHTSAKQKYTIHSLTHSLTWDTWDYDGAQRNWEKMQACVLKKKDKMESVYHWLQGQNQAKNPETKKAVKRHVAELD